MLAAGLVVCAVSSVARADETVPTVLSPPAHTELRYDEDYSYLQNPAARTNILSSVKYIPLNQQGDMYLTLGGQMRDRYEFFNNYEFGTGAQSPYGYNLLRVMLDADLHLGPYVRIFTEGISASEQGRTGGPRASDVNVADLYQAFIDFKIPLFDDSSLTLRAGRQVIVFGAQRLVGVSDFTNVRRTSDGVRAILNTPGNTLNAFFERPVRVLPYDFDDNTPDTFLTGVYDTWKVPGYLAKMNTGVEAYALYVNRGTMTYNYTTSDEKRYTLGTRLTSNLKPFDFDLEADYQGGLFHAQATHAFSVATIAGYSLEDTMFSPRAFLGFDIASGGNYNHPGDTFDELFPSAHDQFGIIDEIGRQNIIDVHPGFTVTLLKDKPGAKLLTLLTQYRQFWRESDQDGLYISSGTLLRPSDDSTARGIGGEVDMQVNWDWNRYCSAYAGYCHFFHGAYISDTGPDRDIDFAYTAVTFTF